MPKCKLWISYVSNALTRTLLLQSWSTCSQRVAGAKRRMRLCRAPLPPSPMSVQSQVASSDPSPSGIDSRRCWLRFLGHLCAQMLCSQQ